jgi:hypoxanthine phosphoribosyltransferase
MARRGGLTRSQQNIVEMLRRSGRRVLVIDETKDPQTVIDEVKRAVQERVQEQPIPGKDSP